MDGFLCKSCFCSCAAPETFWSFDSLWSGVLWKLERRDEGAVDGRSPRLLRVEMVGPPGAAGGFSGRFPRDGAPRLVLEMGTTRLMPWFSVSVRVRTGFCLLAAAGFIESGRVLEVGRVLVGDLDESAFPFVEEAASVIRLVERQEVLPLLALADCSGTSLLSLVEPSTSSSLADAGSVGRHLGEEAGCETGTGWLLIGTGTGFSLAG